MRSPRTIPALASDGSKWSEMSRHDLARPRDFCDPNLQPVREAFHAHLSALTLDRVRRSRAYARRHATSAAGLARLPRTQPGRMGQSEGRSIMSKRTFTEEGRITEQNAYKAKIFSANSLFRTLVLGTASTRLCWQPRAGSCLTMVMLLSSGLGCNAKSKNQTPTPASGPVSSETLTSITSKMKELTSPEGQVSQSALVSWLSARNDVNDVSASEDGSVWGSFNDGPRFCIGTRYPDSQPPSSSNSPSSKALRAKDTDAQSTALSGIPKQAQLRCLAGTGNFLLSPCLRLSTLASKKKYATARGPATIEALRAIHDEGIFILSSHGFYGKRHNDQDQLVTTTDYGIYTQTFVDEDDPNSTLAQYYGRNADGSVNYKDPEFVLMEAFDHYENLNGTVIPIPKWALGITAEFVSKEMHFDPSALVIVSTCSSATEGFAKKQALLDQGVAFAGWTGAMHDIFSYDALAFLLDRLLGTNAEKPEAPPQRAFDWASILKDMDSRNPPLSTWPGNALWPASHLNIESTSSTFAAAAPSLAFVMRSAFGPSLWPSSDFRLSGIFGDVAGEVTVGGTPVDIVNWSSDTILVTLPVSGAGSAGGVIVSSLGRESNPVQLTSWHVHFKYRIDYQTGFPLEPEGTHKLTAEWDLHLRRDIHTFRSAPHVEPDMNLFFAPSWSDDDFTGTWEVNGDYAPPGIDQCTTKWKGSGALKSSTVSADSTPLMLTYDANLQALSIDALPQFHIPNAVTREDDCPKKIPSVSQEDLMIGHLDCSACDQKIFLDPAFGVVRGSLSGTDPWGDKITLEWEPAGAESPPNPDSPR